MSPVQLRDRLADAIAKRDSGHAVEARAMLVELQREHPDDASVNLHCAWAHDKLGLEAEAVPFYERALELGLEGDDLENALLGLGSTYRALGHYDDALRTLTQGVEAFPGHRNLQVFRAMALYNTGRAKEACEALLRLLVETTADDRIRAYQEALDIYSADLDRTWR